jgi:RNA polymerase sigma factor (TIGR02999 family)
MSLERSSPNPEQAIRELLLAWRNGDASALDRLMPLMYDELHGLARRHLQNERSDHTLQTTALLHEAYLKLVGAEVKWEGRVHFLAVAATVMRRILVDHARSRSRQKRGLGAQRVSLDDADLAAPDASIDLLALDDALTRLAAFDTRKARAAELHYFGGLSYEETACALDISEATAHRDLRVAKAWLTRELTQDGGPASAT